MWRDERLNSFLETLGDDLTKLRTEINPLSEQKQYAWKPCYWKGRSNNKTWK